MRYQDIHAGQWLSLKPARKDAYGLNAQALLVLEVVPRAGYKVPWIRCQSDPFNVGMFRPEDFRGYANLEEIPDNAKLHYTRGIGSGATHVRIVPEAR